MKIAFRADASLEIGSGHVVRCLTLAVALRRGGAECHFICRAHKGNLIALIRDSGFLVAELDIESDGLGIAATGDESLPMHGTWLGTDWRTDAGATERVLQSIHPEWLVVDHYAIDHQWERQLRASCKRIMVIDDLADRPHDCDLLLDQTLGRTADAYVGLVPVESVVQTGPRYALLRPEFAELRGESTQRRASPAIRNLLVALGGVDKANATAQVLATLPQCNLDHICSVVVVMGGHAPWLESVEKLAKTLPWPCEVKVDVADMARVMTDCDLAIGAAGGSAWERCALGVPSLVIVAAQNQEAVAKALEQAGAARVVGSNESIETVLPSLLRDLNAEELATMSQSAERICDGRGVERVVNRMNTCGASIRHMCEDDLDRVLAWRNHPDTRRWMYDSHEITFEEHRAWFAAARADRKRHLLIVEESGASIGFVQFTEREACPVAAWGFYVVPGAPSGSGRKLGLMALGYAFAELGFRKICGEVIEFNKASATFHRRLGFAEEGTPHDRHVDDDGEHPVLRFVLDADDWVGC